MLCASSLCDDLHEDKMDVIHTRMLLAVGQQFTNASEHTAITLFFHKTTLSKLTTCDTDPITVDCGRQ